MKTDELMALVKQNLLVNHCLVCFGCHLLRYRLPTSARGLLPNGAHVAGNPARHYHARHPFLRIQRWSNRRVLGRQNRCCPRRVERG